MTGFDFTKSWTWQPKVTQRGVTSLFPAGRWDGLWLELGCSQREELEQVGEGGEPEVVLSSVGHKGGP